MTEEERLARLAELEEDRIATRAARTKVLESQSQGMNGRSIQRADLAELNRMLAKINREINALKAGNSISIRYVVPR